MARIAKRDEEALGKLYDRLAPTLLGMVLRVLSDRAAAEEVLQDVFLRLWKEARLYGQERASATVRLVVAARARAIGRLRAQRGLPALDRGQFDSLLRSLPWLPRPEQVALLDVRRNLVKNVVNQLPKPQRQALELAVFEGYTEAEISQKLAEPLGRVKTELRAAMSFMRHRLRALLGTWAANI